MKEGKLYKTVLNKTYFITINRTCLLSWCCGERIGYVVEFTDYSFNSQVKILMAVQFNKSLLPKPIFVIL